MNPKVRIAATRKTLWGYLDKLAIRIGGGDPHRWNLGDMVMIKDNHLALVPLEEALKEGQLHEEDRGGEREGRDKSGRTRT